MIKALSAFLAVFVSAVAFASDAPVCADDNVVVVHYDQVKEGKLDTAAKDIHTNVVIGAPGQTPYFELTNTRQTTRTITLRILGLTEPEYDFYIDTNPDGTRKPGILPDFFNENPEPPDYSGFLSGTKKKEELEAGISITLTGTHVPPSYRDYYTRLRNGGLEGAKRYQEATDDEAGICRAVMNGVAEWVEQIEMSDLDLRTARFFIVPKGRTFSVLDGGFLPPPQDFLASVKKLGDVVQIARRDVTNLVSNLLYRYDTLEAITPMDFRLFPTGPITPGKKLTVRVAVANLTDRTIIGKIKLNIPSDWQVRDLTGDIKLIGYGRRAEARFEVIVPDSAKGDETIAAAADLMVEGIPLKLQAKSKGPDKAATCESPR